MLVNPSTMPPLPRRVAPPSHQLRVSYALIAFGSGIVFVESSAAAAARVRERMLDFVEKAGGAPREVYDKHVELHGTTVFAVYETPDPPARRVITACLGPKR